MNSHAMSAALARVGSLRQLDCCAWAAQAYRLSFFGMSLAPTFAVRRAASGYSSAPQRSGPVKKPHPLSDFSC